MFGWFTKEHLDAEQQEDWIPQRVAELKSRIAALESRIGRHKESNQTTQAQSEHVVDTRTEKTEPAQAREKDLEMMALKAKLMGKR